MSVTVVEKSDSLRGGGYPIDIRGSAVQVVKRMGLYERLKQNHVDTHFIEFVDGNGERVAKMPVEDITGGEQGSDIEIRRGDLAAALYEATRSEEHTSELQSLMRISYAVFCLKKKKTPN